MNVILDPFNPIKSVLFILFLAFPVYCIGGAGDLDETFGNNGIVITDIGGHYDKGTINKSVLQSDGKILAWTGQKLQRFHSNGNLDETFGNNGELVLVHNTTFESGAIVSDIFLQGDGKIVVGGGKRTSIGSPHPLNTYDLRLNRYLPDGSIDTTFGINGEVIFGLEFINNNERTYDLLRKLAVQDDGSILVAATYRLDNSYREEYVLIRLNSHGVLDEGFGINGFTYLGRLTTVTETTHLLLQPDNKILVSTGHYTRKHKIVRLNINGTVDYNFGDNGYISSMPSFNSMAIQSDGRIVIGGYTSNYPNEECGFGLYRYNSDGSQDFSFGNNGRTLTDFGCTNYPAIPRISSTVRKLGIGPDDQIIAFGERNSWYGYDDNYNLIQYLDLAIAKYHKNGVIDIDFGETGKVIYEAESRNLKANTILINKNLDITAVANDKSYPIVPYTYPHYNPLMIRYHSSGVIDSSFADNGIKTIPVSWASDDEAKDIVLTQSDGKIIVGGSSRRVYSDDFALARYDTEGNIDTSFGENGYVITDFTFDHPEIGNDFMWSQDNITAIKQQADGKILAIGNINRSRSLYVKERTRLGMARYHIDGSLDTSFGTNGKVVFDLESQDAPNDAPKFNEMALQDDGKIVVVGTVYSRGIGGGYTILRFNANGFIDHGFGDNGIVIYDPFNQTGFDYKHELYAVSIQPDGKIITAGGFMVVWAPYYVDINRWNLIRLNTDGSLDTSFYPEGGGGLVNALIGKGWRCYDLALQPDGKIILAGAESDHNLVTNTFNTFTMIRYDNNGYVDLSFGTDGIVNTSFDLHHNSNFLGSDQAKSITLQADGRILLSGLTNEFHEIADDFTIVDKEFGIVRYESHGELDYSFGNGGKVFTDLGSTDDLAENIVVQPDGKILVVGSSSQNYLGLGNQIALVRYEGVSTKVDELEGLVVMIQKLAKEAALNKGQANSLQVKIQAAIQQVDRNNYKAAVNQMTAFKNEIDAMMDSGLITDYQGSLLINEAQTIINLLL